MKYALFLLPVILLACGDHHGDGTDSGHNKPESTATVPISPVTETPGSADTLVWIGIAARWRKAPGSVFDGRYDSASHYFFPCGSDASVYVPRNDIDLEVVSNCDTTHGAVMRLMRMVKGTTQFVAIRHEPIPVSQISGNVAVLVEPNKTDTVLLPSSSVQKIKQHQYYDAMEYQKRPAMK